MHPGRRVLIASGVFPPEVVGGAELVAHRQALGLKQKGFDVSVLAGSTEGVDGPKPWVGQVDGLRVFRIALPEPHAATRPFRLEAHRMAREVVALVRPQAVHLHHLTGLGAGLIPIAKAAGARVVLTVHDTWGFCLRQTRVRPGGALCRDFTECDVCLPAVLDECGRSIPVRMRRDYIRWCLEHADDAVFPSNSLRDSYAEAGVALARCHTISNGIDLQHFPCRLRDPSEQVAFLSLASLAEHKGARVLWDALELLLADDTLAGRWRMMLCGDGPLAAELKVRFDRGSLRAPVRWAGFISREATARAILRADVGVLTSICPENQPVFLMEAAASGAAQVGTRIGGIPEIVEDGQTGLLVPPGDAVALAGALRCLIQDPVLVRRFSEANLARRPSLDEAPTIERMSELLGERRTDVAERVHPVVLCWGAMHGIGAATAASVALRRLDDRIRLLWHEWVGLSPLGGFDVVCVFGDELPAGALARSVLADVPVVAPRQLGLDGVAGCRGRIHGYDSQEEALALVEDLAFRALAQRGGTAWGAQTSDRLC